MKEYTAAEFIRFYHEWYETVKPYSPDPAFEVLDILNKPNPTSVEKRIQEMCAWFDNIVYERLKNGRVK